MLPEKKKKKMERRRRNSAICEINQSPQHFVTLARLALNISASIYKLTKRFPSSSLIFHPQPPNHTLCIKTW